MANVLGRSIPLITKITLLQYDFTKTENSSNNTPPLNLLKTIDNIMYTFDATNGEIKMQYQC
jgi:hypothetical protein